MKWITREKARVDRVACPWLITRFVDTDPEFVFVPADRVATEAEHQGAIPYDVPGVALTHDGPLCSFDTIMREYGLSGKDAALDRLALIVRGADTSDKDLTPESRGLEAIASGFQKLEIDDLERLRLEFPVYDALYAACRAQAEISAPQGQGAPAITGPLTLPPSLTV
jgi:hypothetical protein